MSDNEVEAEMETELHEGGVEETKGIESEPEDPEVDAEDGEEEDEEDIEEPYEEDIEDDELGEDEFEETELAKNVIKSAPLEMSDNYQPYEETSESESSDSDSEDEYVSKVDLERKMEYIKEIHTQEISKTYEEMAALTKVKRRKMKAGGEDVIDDETHKTVPILTKYEKTRILGIRVSQLNEGAPRYINVNETIIDNNIIAEKELRLKKLPFIVTRPLPNGEKEHWRLQDLEIL